MTPHSLSTPVTLLTLLALVGFAVWLRNAYEATERRWVRLLCLVLLAVDFVAFQIVFFLPRKLVVFVVIRPNGPGHARA